MSVETSRTQRRAGRYRVRRPLVGPGGRVARPPQPPKRPPVVERVPFTPTQRIARSTSMLVIALLLAFLVNVLALSQLQHLVAQQQLINTFREQLAAGTAPVSEGDVDDILVQNGAPVGVIDIPAIGVHEVIVEGTASSSTMKGPGHRRDTSLPGQEGESILMGRSGAYGGPFARIQELGPGDRFTVLTGQGLSSFSVIGVRYAGDPTLPDLESGESRLTLITARGPAFVPGGIAYVDAELTSSVLPRGTRQTTFASLATQDFAMASDTSTVWALAFALQLLVAIEIAGVLTLHRVGGRKGWIVFAPLVVLAAVFVATQVAYLLPNLL
jgi:sortase A